SCSLPGATSRIGGLAARFCVGVKMSSPFSWSHSNTRNWPYRGVAPGLRRVNAAPGGLAARSMETGDICGVAAEASAAAAPSRAHAAHAHPRARTGGFLLLATVVR